VLVEVDDVILNLVFFNTLDCTDFFVLAYDFKVSSAFFTGSPVAEKKMRPDYWLRLVPCVPVSDLTLVVG